MRASRTMSLLPGASFSVAIVLVACGPVAGGSDGGSTDSGSNNFDAGSFDAGNFDAGNSDAGGNGCSGATPVELTVKNFDTWCTVTVNGGTPSGAAAQTVCVAAGAVALEDTANSGFVLGDWHHVDGDTGSGVPGTVTGSGQTAQSAATVTVTSGSDCVWVCCPGSGLPCPTRDQCP